MATYFQNSYLGCKRKTTKEAKKIQECVYIAHRFAPTCSFKFKKKKIKFSGCASQIVANFGPKQPQHGINSKQVIDRTSISAQSTWWITVMSNTFKPDLTHWCIVWFELISVIILVHIIRSRSWLPSPANHIRLYISIRWFYWFTSCHSI